jgi:hypothetical protein
MTLDYSSLYYENKYIALTSALLRAFFYVLQSRGSAAPWTRMKGNVFIPLIYLKVLILPG